MVKNTEDSASKFINALIKSVQTLCHGYLDFSDGIQIVGYINLSVDQGPQLDYILKEKVCKNAENSTLFISNSFHAEQKLDQEAGKDSGQRTSEDSEESGRVGSAISSISSALITSRDRHRRGVVKDSDSFHSSQSSGKRKASNDAEVRPSKVSLHHDNSSDSQSPYRSQSSPIESKESLRSHLRTAPEMDMGETMLPQTAGVSGDTAADIGVNLASSVLEPVEDHGDLPERDDDSDGDLEVTFIKEEFVEGERSACEYGSSGGQQFGGPHQRASEGLPDPSLYPVSLQSSSASATYVPGAHDFQPGPSTSQPGHSGMRGAVSQQQAIHPLPAGTKPVCGYVHPSDAQQWRTMMSGGLAVRGKGSRLPGRLNNGQGEGKYIPKEDIEELLRQNMSITDMAQRLSISRPTMYKLLKKHGLESAFRYVTNEQIIESMKTIVADCPEALTDLSLMQQRLQFSMYSLEGSPFSVADKRLLVCMRKLQNELTNT